MTGYLTLLSAELLQLRRRRGLMILSLTIAVGLVAIMFAVLALRHGADPAVYAPAGGRHEFENATDFAGLLSMVVAAMVGATAGAGDAEAGVLRDLVSTGRSRLTLFAARAGAGCLLTLAVTALSLALATACSVALAGHLLAPSAGEVAHRAAAVMAFAAAGALVAAGAAELSRSRGPVIGGLIVVWLIVSQFVLRIAYLGQLRALVPLAAFVRLMGDPTDGIHSSVGGSVAVLAGWSALALGLAAWWSRRVEV